MTADFTVVDVPAMLQVSVTDYDESGTKVPYDGSWHRDVLETLYILAEFLRDKSLIRDGLDVSRRSDLVIRMSDLTAEGRAFVMTAAIDKWMASLDRRKSRKKDTKGLEKRWASFAASTRDAG